ncbi:MAG: ribosomal protein [Patescibacteria group bacterium]|jgi:large subunit ribosomal protein L20|nr:ribosomal protein [Patescibacteria group bacterium]
MPRVKRGTNTHKRHAALLERAKGFRTGRRKLFRRANEALLKAGQFAYRDRRTKKRDLRRGWIVRINAAVREHGLTYSSFIDLSNKKGLQLNRKMLSEMAIQEPAALEALVKTVTAK